MAKVFTSAFLTIACLQFLSINAVSTVTNFTLVSQRLNWNDARDACLHMGGHLVEIHNETKNNVILRLLEQYSAEVPTYNNINIGLANVDKDGPRFYWSETCQPLTWSKLSEDVTQDKLCVKLDGKTGTWTMSHCAYERHYMCEYVTDIKCHYQTYADTVLLSDDVSLFSTGGSSTLESCFRLCGIVKFHSGMDCWAINYAEKTWLCTLFFTNHPYLVTNSSYQSPKKEWTLYTKDCYNVAIGLPFNVTGESNMSPKPEFTCPISAEQIQPATWDLATTPQPRLEENSETTTSVSPVAVLVPTFTFQPPQSSKSTTPNSISGTTLEMEYKTSSEYDETSVIQDMTTGATQTTATTESVTDFMESVTSYNTTTPSLNQTKACSCPCSAPRTLLEKQQFLEEIMTNLNINKTELSSVRRKYESAKDDRPLAVGMGYIGAIFLGITLGLIVLCDVTTFVSRCTRCAV